MSDVKTRRKFTLREWIYFTIVAFALLYMLRGFVSEHAPKIVYSESESLSHSLFVVTKAEGQIKRGDYVTFSIPNNKYMGNASVTKRVLGVSGDIIETTERVVFVNGEEVGVAKPTTRTGIPLEVVSAMTIPQGRYYVSGTHIDSYDSRYKSFGLIANFNISGKAKPIF